MKLYIHILIIVLHFCFFYSNNLLSMNQNCPPSEKVQEDPIDILLFDRYDHIPSIQVQATPKKTISVNTILYATMVGYTLECIETKKRELQKQLNSNEPILQNTNSLYNKNLDLHNEELNSGVKWLKNKFFEYNNALNYCSSMSNRLFSNVDIALYNAINNTNQAIRTLEQEQCRWLSVIKNTISHWFGYPDTMQSRIDALVKSAHALLHIQDIVARKKLGNNFIQHALSGQHYLDTACTIKHTIKNCTRTGAGINTTYTNVQLSADTINHITSFLQPENLYTYEEDIKNMPGKNLDIPEQDIVSCYQWSRPGGMWHESSPPSTTIFFNKNEVGIGGTIGSALYDHCHWFNMYKWNSVRFKSGSRLQPVYSNHNYKKDYMYNQDYGPFYREVLSAHKKTPGSIYPAIVFDADDIRYKKGQENRVYLMFPGETKIMEKEATIKIPNFRGQALYTETNTYKVPVAYDESEKGHGTTWVTRNEADALFAADNKKHGLM